MHDRKRKSDRQLESSSIGDLAARTVQRRAVEAVVWGVPIVSFDAMRQAFYRDAKAKYGDIVYWSRTADWRVQLTTPNASSYYVYFNFNTKNGPVVLDLPAAAEAGLFGALLDAWQVPLVDVGPEGEDQGKGGKYVLLPPRFDQSVQAGYIPVRLETYNGYSVLRAIPATSSEADVAKAIDLVKKIRLYPLAHGANHRDQCFIDMAGQVFDGIVRYDEGFFDSLARMVNEEPIETFDLVAMAQLRSLGIEKNRLFKPDQAMRELFKESVAEAHENFMEDATHVEAYWQGRQWGQHSVTGPKTGFTFRTADQYQIDERALLYYLACAPPRRLGAATFYLAAMRDAAGAPLQGRNTYRLHVPANVPVKQYWAVTVYDLATAGFIRESQRLNIDSYDPKVQKNADGSVDVYFGPVVPAGKETNWIYTDLSKPWFAFFRFYGPEPAVAEKTWQLPDIEKTSK
jgi:hypothetical protein